MSFVLKVDMVDNQVAEKTQAMAKGLSDAKRSATDLGVAASTATSSIAKGSKEATLALEQAKSSTDHLGDSLEGLVKHSAPFASLVAVFEREARVLERIRGPMREHMADMDSLQRLYDRGTINLAEFEKEMQRLITASRAAKGSVAVTADSVNPFAGLTKVFEQEAAMLERIKGPMRDYHTDLVTLDNLHKKGAISTAEFNAQMERLTKNRRPQGMDANLAAKTIGLPALPQQQGLGENSSWIATFAAGGGILALGQQLDSLIHKMHDVEDTFIKVTNEVTKYTDATHGSNVVLAEQIGMAKKLQTGLNASMGLYDAVRDGTDELNYSHREQLRLMETVGKAFTLEGKSTEAAANFMEKFAYSLSSGTINTLELRRAMRQVPEIANLWTERFGVTRNELIELVQTGKISVDQLAQSLIQDSKAIDDNFAKRKRSHALKIEEWNLNEKLAYQRMQDAGLDVQYGDALNAMERARASWSSNRGDYADGKGERLTPGYDLVALEEGQKAIARFIDTADDISTVAARADKSLAMMATGFTKVLWSIDPLTDKMRDFARSVGLAADPWSGDGPEDKFKFAQQAEAMSRINAPANAARRELATLNAVFATGTISAESYRKEYNSLVTTINDGRLPEAIQIWESINEPLAQWGRNIGAINALYRQGRIDLVQYNAELAKQIAANPVVEGKTPRGMVGPRSVGGIDLAIGVDEYKATPGAGDTVQGAAAGLSRETSAAVREYNQAIERQLDLSRQLYEPSQSYQRALEDINGALRLNIISQEYANELYQRASKSYQDAQASLGGYASVVEEIQGPQRRQLEQVEALDRALRAGAISAEQYARAIDQTRAAYLAADPAGRTFLGGMEQAWLKAKMDAESFGQTIGNMLVNDIDKLNQALITFVRGGEVAWGDMVDSMISDLTRLLIKQLEVMAITALLNSIVPGLGTASTSSGATGAIVGAANGAAAPTPTARAYPSPSTGTTSSAVTQMPSAPTSVSIYNVQDKDAGAASIVTRQGQRNVLNVMRMNNGWGRR